MGETYKQEHRLETAFSEATNKLTWINWTNSRNETEGPGDLPARVVLDEEGNLISAFWKKAGGAHREDDLPSAIYFSQTTNEATMYCWARHGVPSRFGDRPSTIAFDERTGTLSELQFCRNGKHYRSGDRHAYFSFDPDGTAYDEDGRIIPFDGFDPAWLPEKTKALSPLLYLLSLRPR
ncbi:hypothetical protein J6595_01335 [Jiella sp. KSK16Y-1]|uniref:Uncharacterized protein n=1 Tax=Jiella mangrovi TaxID=2821407 RepID=A0ABS4BBU6_9HYPH|nr:hypothetical protein [Jiella mangrovi]